MNNPIHATDFYKTGHLNQYPKGTTKIYSNFTPRSARLFNHSKLYDNKVVVFGLQMFIKNFLIEEFNNDFFNQPLEDVIMRYQRRMDGALGVGVVKTDHIEALHKLGYLPLLIKGLPEGGRYDIKVPHLTITNTEPEFFWLVNYLETVLSTEMWKPTTTATTAFEFRRVFEHWANETGGSAEFIPFQGHDFSARGLSNREDGHKASIGHLTSFAGTDTIRAIDGAEDFYGANSDEELVGVSVPATEHSVMSMGGELNEKETIKRLITEGYPSGIISIVSDTWDFWHTLSQTTIELKDEIMARDGKVVFRPDSGDPVDIICGDPLHPDENARKGAIEVLWDIFGGTTNSKGFKTLDSHVGLIYGDSITLDRQWSILEKLASKGFASDNIVLGIGSYSYQYVTRDSLGFAMKATYGEVDGVGREISKNPKTDSGTKKSAVGLLQVLDGILQDRASKSAEEDSELTEVFRDGVLTKEVTLEEIRIRLSAG